MLVIFDCCRVVIYICKNFKNIYKKCKSAECTKTLCEQRAYGNQHTSLSFQATCYPLRELDCYVSNGKTFFNVRDKQDKKMIFFILLF